MIATLNGTVHKRGLLRGLPSPHPLIEHLPSLFQDDPFSQRFVAAFDDALAPIFNTLDNLPWYFDPWLAPSDFVDWLSSWFGMTADESWSVERRRALLAKAFDLYRMRGTAAGLKSQVEALTGGEVELHETGAVSTSTTAGAPFPGSPNFAVLVRITVDDPASVKLNRLDALVAAAKPAHVAHKIELVKRSEVKDAVEVTRA